MTVMFDNIQEIASDELVEALHIKEKIPRRKALSSLEAKVLNILTEEGFVSKTEAPLTSEVLLPDLVEVEDEDDEVVVDGEVDEGDVRMKPVLKKPVPLVTLGSWRHSILFSFVNLHSWNLKLELRFTYSVG